MMKIECPFQATKGSRCFSHGIPMITSSHASYAERLLWDGKEEQIRVYHEVPVNLVEDSPEAFISASKGGYSLLLGSHNGVDRPKSGSLM
eukprot:1160123-Pelagomonas_calceolata.AAC.4